MLFLSTKKKDAFSSLLALQPVVGSNLDFGTERAGGIYLAPEVRRC